MSERGETAGKTGASRRALIAVSDKTGVVGFARILSEVGFEIVSTGGTGKALEEAGIPVTKVADVTGSPEMLGGRVKTLHPRVHGAILADRRDPEHVRQLEEHEIVPVDLVCINLYPFEKTVAGGASEDEAIENIDVGGPAMLRAAAKNFHSVTVVPGPEHYEGVLRELEDGEVSLETRRRLALEAFRKTAAYDAAISAWMAEGEPDGEPDGGLLPDSLSLRYEKRLDLRYGENPHQRAAYYSQGGAQHLLSGVRKLQGKDLSFNNLYDVDAARKLLAEFGDEPAAVIIKHANPCGAAVDRRLAGAYRKALDSDPVSAFGGIVALNGELDGELAAEIAEVFTEVLVARSFTPEAREVFGAKPNAVLLEAGDLPRPDAVQKPVTGGLLVQDADVTEDASGYRTVTQKEPTDDLMRDLLFAWRVAKHVKSNAIVLAKEGATVGVGAGQMSRVDSSEIAIKKAGERVRGAVAASDAFFPFADGVEVLAEAGVAAVIEPGGSRRDDEVIAAADRAGVAMVFTGRRHFLH
ncbi:purH: phosphoribosylaminoimidazolecarboxamide formyltransferase/IMP cyclohydrolase [Rubrobacter radiotolerans]|uniref:Bifunctional purine biosynthesis protein PurH n=1 Tax=Rubrobacter radiotolerans TaxID=42256 RepID=A0A023X2A8_RUBRA|nr:bifunctional phosphoribosylaminoimidazolecarboxamide formyltransferase/IMP cyclohydrolase [Rubrobacter radiotolerans]AHY46199.1 purH: phosphoribosylaminoimidazolecarboxamide formyltransferase/IMP cyclohydrolase [Rubrobacter radiotolerans]MDX5893608.1 bifunctional phosphoribosylaminoimidazolecarboxamide formyltransferase/IMP cyclohydrolase [Rubrobacter radiotolerans]SMC04112.1 phosphoribosylaminoimidazolecarboxamide formyltransferase / IMP cyclohydrolase [Rubrobacter radiotolerans DSM 5868]